METLAIEAVVFVLVRDGAVLMERCPRKARVHGGEWFLPGGRIEPIDATPTHAMMREMREELGCTPAAIAARLRLVDCGTERGPCLMAPFLVEHWHGYVPDCCLDQPDVPLRWVPLAEAMQSPVYAVRATLTQLTLTPAGATDAER